MDDNSKYWVETKNYQSFELRSHRFRDDMLPVFYKWLGINGGSKILDGGCGSGVFTRYLANGLTTGHITGFDINETFIEYGNQKIAELGLEDKAALEIANGYRLPYPDGRFDAVTNYTYTGVLSDMRAGIGELIRVCKNGGVVSCVVATNAMSRIGCMGGCGFDGADELRRLSEWEWDVFVKTQERRDAPRPSELESFIYFGLGEIHLYPFAHLICYADTNFPAEYRKRIAIEETEEEINWLPGRYAPNEKFYAENGFARGDYERLTGLLEMKLEYIKNDFEARACYEWRGGFNYIVTGKK